MFNKNTRKMKKVVTIFAVAVAMLAAGSAKAQVGFHIGYMPETFTNETTVLGTTATTESDLSGFYLGFHYNTSLSGDLGLMLAPQVRWNMKNEETTVLGVTNKNSQTQILIDLPILFNYGIDFGGGIKLSAFAGPTVSFALVGKTKNTVAGTEVTTEWYGDDGDSDRSRLNLYGTVGLALTYSNFSLFGGYNLGILDMHKNENVKLTSGGLFFGLGFGLE